MTTSRALPPYRHSLAGNLLAAREAVMAPLRPTLREAGVTEQQWRVLRVLADEGEIDPSRLAVAALLHAPSVTRILKELTDRGLVERRMDPTDGRRSFVRLATGGQQLLDATVPLTRATLQRYADCFGQKRLQSLLQELEAFTRAIEDVRASDT